MKSESVIRTAKDLEKNDILVVFQSQQAIDILGKLRSVIRYGYGGLPTKMDIRHAGAYAIRMDMVTMKLVIIQTRYIEPLMFKSEDEAKRFLSYEENVKMCIKYFESLFHC